MGLTFEHLLDSHRVRLFGFLYRLVESQELAEQLGREVLEAACKEWGSHTHSTRSVACLFRLAVKLVARHDSAGRTDASFESNSLVLCVRRAIACLPAAQRAAVLLHKYEKLDYAQIAMILECSDSAVQRMLMQAYQKLRAQAAIAPCNPRHAYDLTRRVAGLGNPR